MERYIATIKNNYAASIQKKDRARALELIQSEEYSPITKLINLTEDEEPQKEYHNTFLKETNIDLEILDNQLVEASAAFADLYYTTISRLDEYLASIKKEEELQHDLQFLCGAYSDFDTLHIIEDYDDNFYAIDNNIYCAAVEKRLPVILSVVSVDGNGYEGNAYVKYLSDNVYKNTKDILDTSDRSYLLSADSNQYYEYSRLTGKGNSFSAVNNDSIEAKCSIVLNASDIINTLIIETTQKNIVLKELYVSSDNILYSQVNSIKDLKFYSDEDKYKDGEYIYNSGVVCFPDARYIKLIFESGGNVKDIIGYEQVKTNEKGETYQETVVFDNVSRHAIKINRISAFKAIYKTENSYTINNLLSDANLSDLYSFAIYCNEYIPNYYNSKEYIQYYLTINDKTYQMAPINSNKNHSKIIKVSKDVFPSDYTQYISETIKNISLKIVLKTLNETSTPYISNLKILLGSQGR